MVLAGLQIGFITLLFLVAASVSEGLRLQRHRKSLSLQSVRKATTPAILIAAAPPAVVKGPVLRSVEKKEICPKRQIDMPMGKKRRAAPVVKGEGIYVRDVPDQRINGPEKVPGIIDPEPEEVPEKPHLRVNIDVFDRAGMPSPLCYDGGTINVKCINIGGHIQHLKLFVTCNSIGKDKLQAMSTTEKELSYSSTIHSSLSGCHYRCSTGDKKYDEYSPTISYVHRATSEMKTTDGATSEMKTTDGAKLAMAKMEGLITVSQCIVKFTISILCTTKSGCEFAAQVVRRIDLGTRDDRYYLKFLCPEDDRQRFRKIFIKVH